MGAYTDEIEYYLEPIEMPCCPDDESEGRYIAHIHGLSVLGRGKSLGEARANLIHNMVRWLVKNPDPNAAQSIRIRGWLFDWAPDEYALVSYMPEVK